MTDAAIHQKQDPDDGGFEPLSEISGVVHDLRHPLHVMSGYAAMLAAGDLGPLTEAGQKAVNAIMGKADEMNALLEGLLDVTSGEDANRVASRVESADLSEAAQQAAERARPRAELCAGEVEVVTPPGDVPVRADPRSLRRILDNLLNNALSYSRTPPRLVIRVSRSGGYGEIRVEDNGRGIDPSVQGQLFSNRTRASRQSGAGLGLMLSHKLALRMGGELRLEESSDAGSVFTFSLPLAR